MEAVLLVGGKGTRLAPLTQVLPKPLLPVGGVPITEIIIRQLVHAGFSRIHMCTGYLADYIRLYFQDGERWKASIQYTQEEMPLGTAGPLGYLKGKLERDFLMMNGDLITTLDYARLYHFHLEQGAHLTLAAHQQEESNASCTRGEYLDMPQLINQLIAAGKRLHVHTSEDLWMDVGCHDAFERAQRLFPDIRDRILPRGDE